MTRMGITLLLALALWCLAPAPPAAGLPVVPVWQAFEQVAPLPSYWVAEGLRSTPVVAIRGGRGGVHCVPDTDAVLSPTQRCIVWAQGWWWEVVVDGAAIAQRHGQWLPLMRS